MSAMVPHSRHRGIQQSADMLRNRSTLLKLEKNILITIIFTIMCTMCRQRQCGCRRRCPQPLMDHLQRFQCNSSILWTYCHRPVARFPRRRLGRQSKYGRSGGDLGGSTMVDLALSTCAFPPLAEFGESACDMTLPTMVLLMGGRGGTLSASRGDEKLLRLMVLIGTVGCDGTTMFVFLMACTSVKKYGHHMILIWCHTYLGSLYTMVPSDWYGNAV
jgi:hypothetical protein